MSLYILIKSSKYGNIVTLLGEDKAEAVSAADVARAIAEASGRAAARRIVDQDATAKHATGAR